MNNTQRTRMTSQIEQALVAGDVETMALYQTSAEFFHTVNMLARSVPYLVEAMVQSAKMVEQNRKLMESALRTGTARPGDL